MKKHKEEKKISEEQKAMILGLVEDLFKEFKISGVVSIPGICVASMYRGEGEKFKIWDYIEYERIHHKLIQKKNAMEAIGGEAAQKYLARSTEERGYIG